MESIRLCPTLEIKCKQINNEPRHEISNNVVCATSKGQTSLHMCSLIRAFASCLNTMTVKLLTEQHLEFLSLTGGCTGSYKSTHCWKSHVAAQYLWCSYKMLNIPNHFVTPYLHLAKRMLTTQF